MSGKKLCISSLVLGIVGLAFSFFLPVISYACAIPGLIIGVKKRRKKLQLLGGYIPEHRCFVNSHDQLGFGNRYDGKNVLFGKKRRKLILVLPSVDGTHFEQGGYVYE